MSFARLRLPNRSFIGLKVPAGDTKYSRIIGYGQVFGHAGAGCKGPANTSNVGKHTTAKGEGKRWHWDLHVLDFCRSRDSAHHLAERQAFSARNVNWLSNGRRACSRKHNAREIVYMYWSA
jgi:hypothetical protein